MLTFQETMFLDGAIDIAVTRTTLMDFQGYGPIVHGRIVTTDNLSGYADLPIGVSGVTALSSQEEEVLLSVIGDTVHIDPNKVGVVEPEQLDISIYPNPTNGLVTIDGITEQTNLSVMNAVGQVVFRTNLGTDKSRVDLSHLNSGLYVIKLETDKAVAVDRLRLIR